MRSIYLLLAALCLALPCLRAAEMSIAPGGAGAVSVPPQADSVPRRGALYRVRHGGETSYLFGTIHVGKDAFFPLEPEVTRALSASSTLVLELDIRQDQPFQLALDKHGRYGANDTIVQHIAPATLGRLVLALGKSGLSLQSVERYKPWLVANVLIGIELERHGYQRSQAVEYFLLAASQGKTVRELESAEYQLGLFDTLDDAQQEQYLRENLADLEDGQALRKSRNLIDAWSSADRPRMDALWRDAISGDSVSASFMQRTLLGKRNPEMASAIERMLQQDPRTFVGVGLLHLLGDNGVPQLLRERGYQVDKIY